MLPFVKIVTIQTVLFSSCIYIYIYIYKFRYIYRGGQVRRKLRKLRKNRHAAQVPASSGGPGYPGIQYVVTEHTCKSPHLCYAAPTDGLQTLCALQYNDILWPQTCTRHNTTKYHGCCLQDSFWEENIERT